MAGTFREALRPGPDLRYEPYYREIARLREGLLKCARVAGADVPRSKLDSADIVEWAVGEVRRLRKDYEDVAAEVWPKA